MNELLIKAAENLGAELSMKILMLNDRYGDSLTVEQYAEYFKLKESTVYKQISDETIAVRPVKIGRENLFCVIEVAKLFYLNKP